MPLAKQDWLRSPNMYVFDTIDSESLGPITTVAGTIANTTVSSILPLPYAVKVPKISIAFTGVGATTGTFAVNIVYNTVIPFTSTAYSIPASVGNDNSFTGPAQGPSYSTANPYVAGALGMPTNFAIDNTPLFSTDIVVNTTNFPGATTAGGCAIFIPTNYDTFYPSGFLPNTAQTPVTGFFTLRLTQPAATVFTNLIVTLCLVPATPRENWQTPANPQNACIPGQAW